MARKEHIDDILRRWPYDSDALGVRMVKGADGRSVLQMRVDMGILQLETEGRPDGTQPFGERSYFDHLQSVARRDNDELLLNEDQCEEVDREFVQFYHRRICWLRLQKYRLAVRDADHTLALMDFCRDHSPDEQWTMSHEQYRPFVMFHRIQAAALASLQDNEVDVAIQEINQGLERMHGLFVEHDLEDEFDDDELVNRLTEMRETLRREYNVGRTLQEQLADAVAAEEYELAARLRDELAQRRKRPQPRR